MFSYEGFLQLKRKLFLTHIWQLSKPEHKVILIVIMASAFWEAKEWEWNGRPYKCEINEFIGSYDKIAKDCGKGITKQMVRDALNRFKKLGFLKWEAGKTRRDGIKVTILKDVEDFYCEYLEETAKS